MEYLQTDVFVEGFASMSTDTAPDVAVPHLPPSSRLPRSVQGALFIASRRRLFALMRRRHGVDYTVNVPMFGNAVVLGDTDLIRQLFLSGSDAVHNIRPNLGRVLGRASMFSLEGEEHRRQRKLLTPPFHGRRMREYESIIAEETLAEARTWPSGSEFESLAPMMRITLNAILRAVFGAEGEELEVLRRHMPEWIEQGSRISVLPKPPFDFPGSPWRRFHTNRRRFDDLVDTLVAKAQADPDFENRSDILSLMLRSRYDDGTALSRKEIADQLLTMLAAGHETTANTLAWAIERLTRHPDVLRRLYDEVDAGGSELRQAVIYEVQRSRPVIDLCGRTVTAESLTLGEWTIPRGRVVLVSIAQVQADEALFPHADRFDPDRFLGSKPSTISWIPFGGGTRRCIGAAFANMEMDVVLRELLRHYAIEMTTAADEAWHSRGVAFNPAKGGRVRLSPRGVASTGVADVG
ncbi:cytochrome P450 [Williamsia maris]